MRNVVFIDLGRSENEDVINQKCVFFYARVFSAYQAFCFDNTTVPRRNGLSICID